MYILIGILSIWIFIKTTSYGLYEIKQQQNKFGGTFVIILAIIALVFPTLMVILRGLY